jgi:hypothetical protein
VPNPAARRLPVMIALAVLACVGIGFGAQPAPAYADDGPVAVPVSPVDGGLLDVGDLEFAWTAPDDAAGYELRTGLDGRVDDAGALVDAPSTTTLLTSAPALTVNGLPEGTYYWQVRARDAAGEPGPWSPVRMVAIDLPGDDGGLQLETLALGDYVVEQPAPPQAVAPARAADIGPLSIVIATGFSVLLLSVVLLRAAAVRVRT